MPRLVDTTIRLLGQEPLAGLMPTSQVLRLAEILDGAGFEYLEVSGGGVFDTAVRRGVESPWDRIRALKVRTKRGVGLGGRGRSPSGAASSLPRAPSAAPSRPDSSPREPRAASSSSGSTTR